METISYIGKILKEALVEIDPHNRSNITDTSKAAESIYEIISSYPRHIADRIHPEWLEKIIQEHQSQYHIHIYKPYSMCFLRRILTGIPIVETRFRFTSISWKDVHLLSWQKLFQLDTALQVSQFSLGDCCKTAWSPINAQLKNQMASWVYYKLAPESAVTFMQEFKFCSSLKSSLPDLGILRSIAIGDLK